MVKLRSVGRMNSGGKSLGLISWEGPKDMKKVPKKFGQIGKERWKERDKFSQEKTL